MLQFFSFYLRLQIASWSCSQPSEASDCSSQCWIPSKQAETVAQRKDPCTKELRSRSVESLTLHVSWCFTGFQYISHNCVLKLMSTEMPCTRKVWFGALWIVQTIPLDWPPSMQYTLVRSCKQVYPKVVLLLIPRDRHTTLTMVNSDLFDMNVDH